MPCSHSRRPSRGFTLIELIFTLVIAAILAVVGIPAMQDFLAYNARTTAVNRFVLAIQYARSESVTRREYVAVCKKSPGSVQCAGSGMGWSKGWLVFVDQDRDYPVQLEKSDQLLRVFPGVSSALQTHANRNAFTLRPMGKYSTNGTFTVCSVDNAIAPRAVIVSVTGRPRGSDVAADGSALECPGP